MRTKAVLALASVALATIMAAAASAGRKHAGAAASPTAAVNALTAQSSAASLLALVRLPSGAVPSAAEPTGDAGTLSHPGSGPPETPDVVDDSAWWTVAASAQSVMQFATAHPPSGSTSSGGGGGGGDFFETFSWPAITNVLWSREVIIEATPLADGLTGVRVDSQVVWIIPRPPSERIPPGSRRLWVTTSGSASIPGSPSAAFRPLLVSSQAKIGEVVALLNRLPLFQPGVVACPLDLDIRVHLALYPRRGVPPLALADIDPGGCSPVELTINGQTQPLLDGEWFPGSGITPMLSLIALLDRALGVTIPTGFPLQPTSVATH